MSVWHIEGFDSTDTVVFDILVTGMSRADFARVLGLDEHTYDLGGEYELTGPVKAELTDRLGLRFDPGVQYFAGEYADFPGHVRHGRTYFADDILPWREQHGNRLVFGLTDVALADEEIALLLTSHTRYPTQTKYCEFTEATPREALATHPDAIDLIHRASAVFTAHNGYLLLVDRDRAEVTLFPGPADAG